ncbi:MAG: DJ-1/PfpI family protein [Bacteroides sp.]|nr:DJ-1/PfpI family protein [Bacteroides sp.]
MNTVYMFFADGFEEIEALATVDILRRAGMSVQLVSITGDRKVTGAHDVSVCTDTLFEACDFSDADLLVLPGGMPGAATLGEHAGLRALLSDYVKQDKPLAAICAAPMVLGQLGLLKGKKAICYPGFEHYLEGAEIVPQQVVVDGQIVTGRGPGAAVEFALTLVEILEGKEKKEELIQAMCIHP